jgi:hypothetical protein
VLAGTILFSVRSHQLVAVQLGLVAGTTRSTAVAVAVRETLRHKKVLLVLLVKVLTVDRTRDKMRRLVAVDRQRSDSHQHQIPAERVAVASQQIFLGQMCHMRLVAVERELRLAERAADLELGQVQAQQMLTRLARLLTLVRAAAADIPAHHLAARAVAEL